MPVSPIDFKRALVAGARFLGDRVAPALCFGCDRVLHEDEVSVCEGCRGELVPLEAPWCARCGISERRTPSGFPGQGDLCAGCSACPPAYERARALWSYEGPIERAWTKVKYGRDLGVLRDVCGAAEGQARELLVEWREEFGPLSVTGVPMHPGALMRRGFNQSVMLADRLSRGIVGVDLEQGLVRKTRRTAQQAGLGRAARQHNLAGAFAASRPRHATVVVVDDVMTSGATAGAMAEAIRLSGALRALTLVLARAQT